MNMNRIKNKDKDNNSKTMITRSNIIATVKTNKLA